MREIESVRTRLREAIESGELISIIYHGGSQAGAKREVLPVELNGDMARCRCYTSGAVKTFALSKIEIVGAPVNFASAEGVWKHGTPSVEPRFMSVVEIHIHYRAELEAKGWIVEVDEDGDGAYLNLYDLTKYGKRRAHPKVTLSFEHTASDFMIDADGNEFRGNFRPRTRPWSVRSSKGSAGTWKDCDKAVSVFLKEAGLREAGAP